ncbi:MAG: hypothetical protein HY830_19975 [Actinobacteria bacterium]|nr:hypothetical protein [Actinomycetota bacterium]
MPRTSRGRRSVALLVTVTAPLLVALGVLLPGSAAAAPVPPSAAALPAAPGPVVLLGTGGLRWDDVSSSTPALQSLLGDGAIGTLAVRTVRRVTCPLDGWLTISAGRRAGDADDVPAGGPACRAPQATVPSPGGPGTATRWDVFRREAEAGWFEATPGLLATTLAAAGVRTAAVGAGAVVALADPQGTAPVAYPGLAPLPTGGPDETGNPTDLADDVRAAIAGGARLVVVDLGAVRDRADRAPGEPVPPNTTTTGQDPWPDRASQVQTIDTRLLTVLGELPSSATAIVASTADSGQTPHLQLLAARGPAAAVGADGVRGTYAEALLGSRSTRQDGMAQTTDLFPTLLAALGVAAPADAVGSPLAPVSPGGDGIDRLERVVDLDTAALAVQPVVPIFFNVLIAAQLVLYGVATVLLRRPTSPTVRRRTLAVLRRVAVVFASVPAATFLANLLPWWRGQHPGLAVSLYVALFVLPIAALALLGPWRRALLGPFGVVGGVTALVLAGDVLTGSRLVISSLMGVQPVVAGRFYGFSNPGFALFATGCLLAATAGADWLVNAGRRRTAALTVAGVGLACLVVDGTPGLGSDFGGPPAIVPAFALLALWVAGVKITWRRALLIGGGTVVVLVGLSVVDWLRPAADRTHLGRFVQTVVDGGALAVVQRKALQNLGILFKPLSALLPFAVAFVVLVLARPVAWGARPLQLAYDRSSVLRHGLASFAILVGIGFALNDSGTAIPAVAATVAIPLLISASVRALELHETEHPPPDPRKATAPGVQPGAAARKPRPRTATRPRPTTPPSTGSRASATAPRGDESRE